MEQLDLDPLQSGLQVVGGAIGNGCWGTTVGTCAHGAEQQDINAEFFFGHGMYSQPLREEILLACGDFATLSEECEAQLDVMYDQMGDYDVYNIYDECGSDNMRINGDQKKDSQKPHSTMKDIFHKLALPNVTVQTQDSFSVSGGYHSVLKGNSEKEEERSVLKQEQESEQNQKGYKCGGHQAMNAWLAEPSVMAALHVLPGTVGMTYHKTAGDLLPLYTQLIRTHQMLIYSGDTDGCVPFVGTEKWTRELPFSQTRGWHQWFAQDKKNVTPSPSSLHKAGYAITYDQFQFVTVSGAGACVKNLSCGEGCNSASRCVSCNNVNCELFSVYCIVSEQRGMHDVCL